MGFRLITIHTAASTAAVCGVRRLWVMLPTPPFENTHLPVLLSSFSLLYRSNQRGGRTCFAINLRRYCLLSRVYRLADVCATFRKHARDDNNANALNTLLAFSCECVLVVCRSSHRINDKKYCRYKYRVTITIDWLSFVLTVAQLVFQCRMLM